jgi:hypothetical protein
MDQSCGISGSDIEVAVLLAHGPLWVVLHTTRQNAGLYGAADMQTNVTVDDLLPTTTHHHIHLTSGGDELRQVFCRRPD